MSITIESIARAAHEANRAYCQAIGDNSQPAWEDAPDWQRQSAIDGVEFHIDNPEAGPEASHENWLEQKEDDGWTYGETKDPEAKTHPCMVPFDQLPPEQQAKDYLFRSICHSLIPHLDVDGPTPFDTAPGMVALSEESLGKDLLQAMVDELKVLQDPWAKTPEHQQNHAIDRLRHRIKDLISRTVALVARGDFPAVNAHVEGVTFKDGVKATLSLSKCQGAHELADREGSSVVIVITDPDEYVARMEDVKGEADQRGLLPDADAAEDDRTRRVTKADDVRRLLAAGWVLTGESPHFSLVNRETGETRSPWVKAVNSLIKSDELRQEDAGTWVYWPRKAA